MIKPGLTKIYGTAKEGHKISANPTRQAIKKKIQIITKRNHNFW